MKKKILLSVAIFFLTFIFASAVKTNAASITGWLWGGTENPSDGLINGNETGVGWISVNNSSGGGAIAYNVDIPATNGNLSGYAWSENIGWVSFNSVDLSGCPSGTCSARRAGDNLEGWARIKGIMDAGANAGGWLGWISLKGSNYGVSVSGSNLAGYAWSDELGWIDFSRTNFPLPPSITLSANPITINVDTNPLQQNTTLTWSVTDATSCTASSTNNSWTGAKNNVSGTDTVQITAARPSVDFTLTCSGPGGNDAKTVNVTTVCYEHSCAAGICAETPTYGVSSSAVCVTQECTNDSQCAPVTTGIWKEVAP